MKKNVFFMAGILLLSLLLLPGLTGCGAISSVFLPTVSESEVFHTADEISAEYGGSRNVTVEQIPGGMRATGAERGALIEIGSGSFSLGPEPEESEFDASVLGISIHNGRIALFVVRVSLGTDSYILALAPNAYPFDPDSVGFLPGAPGSENVTIRVDPGVGYTEAAGLRFTEEVILNVWENGIVELNKENVVVSDTTGQQWVSRRVRIGEQSAIVLVKK